MQEKTPEELLAEINQLSEWKRLAATELLRWIHWAAIKTVGITKPGESLFGAMVEYVASLESSVAGLRDGLEDIKSLRRVNCVEDVPSECDFYLTRDER
jgi:hypothetical protein